MSAAYIEAYRSGRLDGAIRRASRWMKKCTMCPRMCGVDRASGETGYCGTGRWPVVASFGPHYGEERPLVGKNGSGAVFFSRCNLSCVFCQNYEISHRGEGTETTPEELSEIMLALQQRGCHNINFVTPSHVIHAILESLPAAIEKGLRIPLVYNCGGYERVPALKLLDGIVDIYMPDFKFWDSDTSARMCGAADYPERARAALKEMHRQVGDLAVDGAGVAQRGLLVRHLVMPNRLAGTREVMEFLAKEISPDTYVNLMDQYHPCGGAFGDPRINRRITAEEFREALDAAGKAGIFRLEDRRGRRIMIEF